MDLTRKVDLRAFTLADPYRVVIDMPQVTFKLPAVTGESGRGLVKAFRYGLVMHGRLAYRARSDAAGADRKGLRARSRGRPAGAARARSGRRPTAKPSCATLRRNTPPTLATSGAARSASRAPSRRSAADDRDRSRAWRPRYRHGRASGESWKRRSCSISRCCCATSSRRSGKYRVVMTRTDDTFIPLAERVSLARHPAGGAVHLDPCRRAEEARRRCAGRDRLHAVGDGLRRRGRPARRNRKSRRRDRRHRSPMKPTTSPTS